MRTTDQAGAVQDATVDRDLQREVELEKARQPWWRKSIPVASIVTLLGVMVTATTGVWASIQKDRELRAQQSKQTHEATMEELKLKHSIQMDYLDRLKNDPERLRTLRMVEAISDDPKMIAWAHNEQGLVATDIATMQKQIDDQKAAADVAAQKAEQAVADGTAKAGVIAQLRANALRQEQDLERLREPPNRALACANPYDECLASIAGQTGTALAFAKVNCKTELAICLKFGPRPK